MTVAILAVVLLAPIGAQASEGDCDPIINVQLSREDQEDGQTTLVFAVAVNVRENNCSKVNYKMPRGRSLVKYEVESITCYECGNEP